MANVRSINGNPIVVNTSGIENGAVTSAKLADGAIAASKFADEVISTAKLSDGAVTTAKLADGSVGSAKIADGSISSGKIANDAVTNTKIADDSVTTAKIADGAVTLEKLGNDIELEPPDGSVTSGKIANLSVTTSKLAEGSVTPTKLADSAATTPKVADGAITTAKLADGSITSDKVADGSVGKSKLASGLDKLDEIVKQLVEDQSIIDLTWSQGGIGNNGFSSNTYTWAVRSDGYTSFDGRDMVVLDIPDGLEAAVFEYTSNTTFSAGNELVSLVYPIASTYAINVTDGHYYRFNLYAADQSNLTPEAASASGFAAYEVIPISERTIDDGSVTTAKVADNAITREKLAIGIDKLDEVVRRLVRGNSVISPTWSQGSIGNNGFSSNTYTWAVRSSGYISFDAYDMLVLDVPDGIGVGVFEYTSNTTYGAGNTLVSLHYPVEHIYVLNVTDGHYYRFSLYKLDQTAFTPADAAACGFAAYEVSPVGALSTTEYTDASMFTRIGVLGDSYCSGALYFTASDRATYYEQSWPANLGRQSGVDVVRYSVGGWGTYNFLYNDNDNWLNYGSHKLIEDFSDPQRICGLYIIAFGINDSYPSATWGDRSGGTEYIGSSADVDTEDYTNNANSYWGNLSKIISTIKAGAPDAKIVLSTLARFGTSRYDEYSAAIPEIAAYNGVPYITLTDDDFFNSDFYTHLLEGHPTAQLYAGMAKAINRLLSRCIVENWEYFQTYRGINNR